MLKYIIEQLSAELKDCGVKEVYTAFDNIPADSKGGEPYTVVSVEGFESTAPIYTDSYLYIPFKADACISLVAPRSVTMAQLYDRFDREILPVVEKIGSMKCTLKNLTMKYDTNMRKTVLKMRLCVSGLSRLERSLS